MRRKQKFCLGDSFLECGDMEESCQEQSDAHTLLLSGEDDLQSTFILRHGNRLYD